MFRDAVTCSIAEFLISIGIEVLPAELTVETFLPGILVEGGRLLVDESRLIYPGDLLHEAGHLAVADGQLRKSLCGEVIIPGANMNAVEVLATAWAYAAVRHLGIDPKILFHEGGYMGKSEGLLFTYGVGVYPGASGLQALGLTAMGEEARRRGVSPYPHMLKWLRD
ncbi:MAG TPA: hypothetical protein VF717_12075 [Pyrinomonadaceae bacterium]|jgi:hypothetical protein